MQHEQILCKGKVGNSEVLCLAITPFSFLSSQVVFLCVCGFFVVVVVLKQLFRSLKFQKETFYDSRSFN